MATRVGPRGKGVDLQELYESVKGSLDGIADNFMVNEPSVKGWFKQVCAKHGESAVKQSLCAMGDTGVKAIDALSCELRGLHTMQAMIMK